MPRSKTSSRREATVIFIVITLSGLLYYALNNVYASWAYDPTTNVWLELAVYYVATQPIYVVFLWLMHDKWGPKGFLGAVLLMISSDLMSLPHSFPSLWHPSETAMLPNDPNISPYPDWQLARLFSPSGVITFQTAILVGIVIPTLLNLAVYVIVKPKRYKELVEHM